MRYRFISHQLLKLPLRLITPQVILACCSWVMLWRDEWGLWEGAAGRAVFAGRAPPCAQGSLHSPV